MFHHIDVVNKLNKNEPNLIIPHSFVRSLEDFYLSLFLKGQTLDKPFSTFEYTYVDYGTI